MEELIQILEIYYDNPKAFLEDMLDMDCDDWQGLVASDVANYPKVAVKSGQGVGKTALEAGLIIWFLVCRPYSKVLLKDAMLDSVCVLCRCTAIVTNSIFIV